MIGLTTVYVVTGLKQNEKNNKIILNSPRSLPPDRNKLISEHSLKSSSHIFSARRSGSRSPYAFHGRSSLRGRRSQVWPFSPVNEKRDPK